MCSQIQEIKIIFIIERLKHFPWIEKSLPVKNGNNFEKIRNVFVKC